MIGQVLTFSFGPRSADEVLAKLIGKSPDLVMQLPTLEQAEAAVLITGETGTGKELMAQANHTLSLAPIRRDQRRVFPRHHVGRRAVWP